MTLVATQVKRRRGTTAENDAFTGAEGEITVDLTTHELRVHDGSTVGGYAIPTKNYGYSKTESNNLLSNKANVALDNLTSAGKEVCANMAMPSNRYISLTVGSTGANYVAPADGYFHFLGRSTSQYGNISISIKFGSIELISSNNYCQYTNSYMHITIPVSKGQTAEIGYFNTDTLTLRFVYANGGQ